MPAPSHDAPSITCQERLALTCLFVWLIVCGLSWLAMLFYWLKAVVRGHSVGLEVGFILSTAVVISILISEACDPFADAAQWVGCRLKLPPSVRGATLDAIASSMPELFTGLFFVAVALSGDKDNAQRLLDSAEGYGSTIATCAGSSIYNLILIPAVCAIAISFSRPRQPYIAISPDVLRRDGMWVILVQLGLLIVLFQSELHWWMGGLALLAYAAYVLHLYLATRNFRRQVARGEIEQHSTSQAASLFFGSCQIKLNGYSSLAILVGSTLVAAAACYLLVELTNESADTLGVAPFFVAVILTAAVSSIPDTFMSLGSARRGDDSGAISNVFGSNIFDICVGMSIPLIVSCYLNDWQPIRLVGENNQTQEGVAGLRVLLFLLSVVAMSILWKTKRLSRPMGWFFVTLYLVFVGYAILGAMGVINA